ncbi:MAG TPA: D-Ala-D-Ala carboxypeptidase family metallohydrolase [Polyangia bacterium]|nr:D-Ala-D-Ala carboxypeptidase family metallohydrolase [Polyangia bacterium]
MSTLPPSQFFDPKEFACRDGTWYPEAWTDRWALLSGLCDDVRRIWGGPLLVVSGYRTQIYNDKLLASGHHPAANSEHIQGNAADLRPVQIPGRDTVLELHEMILRAYDVGQLPTLGGLGLYGPDAWIHVDTMKAADGHLRRWSLR